MTKSIFDSEVLRKIRVIGIYGSIRTGKTALAYRLIESYQKPIYFLNHPQPELVESLGYKNLQSMNEIAQLQDCVVYWDEPQLAMGGVKDYLKSEILAKFCSLAGQREIHLILSSSDTRVFNARMEAYVELWLLKDLEYSMTKQRSMIRRIIQQNCLFMPEEFSVKLNEFVAYSRLIKECNGRHSFEVSEDWSEDLSTPYRLTENS